jgi:hypothetical protein
MRRRQTQVALQRPSELERVEALCDALVERMGSGTRKTAARVIRSMDRDRRDRMRARRDPRFTPSTRVGRLRRAEITALLEEAGWTLRETVDRKLPLMGMPQDLQTLVRHKRLEPSKALLLNRVKQRDLRVALTNQALHGMTLQQLYQSIYQPNNERTHMPDDDLRYLEREMMRALGTRVVLTSSTILIDYHQADVLSGVLDRLGLQV